jgi:hypothetical protein
VYISESGCTTLESVLCFTKVYNKSRIARSQGGFNIQVLYREECRGKEGVSRSIQDWTDEMYGRMHWSSDAKIFIENPLKGRMSQDLNLHAPTKGHPKWQIHHNRPWSRRARTQRDGFDTKRWFTSNESGTANVEDYRLLVCDSKVGILTWTHATLVLGVQKKISLLLRDVRPKSSQNWEETSWSGPSEVKKTQSIRDLFKPWLRGGACGLRLFQLPTSVLLIWAWGAKHKSTHMKEYRKYTGLKLLIAQLTWTSESSSSR